MVPSIASIPRFAQNPRASPSAFAVLCAKPQGAIFAVNEGFGACEGIFTFFCNRGSIVKLHPSFRHTSTFYKKSQVLCLLPPGFAAIRINFIAASKKNAPSRGESLWAVRSSFLLFKFFYLSNQAAQTVKTAVHSGARRTQHRYHPEHRWHHLCAGHQRRDGHRGQLHHTDRHHRCFHRGQLEQLRRRLIMASFRSRVSAAAKRIQRFI